DDAGHDFDDADRHHEGVRRDAESAGDRRGEVLVPVRQQAEELVQARDDRRDCESKFQEKKRLMTLFAHRRLLSTASRQRLSTLRAAQAALVTADTPP